MGNVSNSSDKTEKAVEEAVSIEHHAYNPQLQRIKGIQKPVNAPRDSVLNQVLDQRNKKGISTTSSVTNTVVSEYSRPPVPMRDSTVSITSVMSNKRDAKSKKSIFGTRFTKKSKAPKSQCRDTIDSGFSDNSDTYGVPIINTNAEFLEKDYSTSPPRGNVLYNPSARANSVFTQRTKKGISKDSTFSNFSTVIDKDESKRDTTFSTYTRNQKGVSQFSDISSVTKYI